MKIIFAGTPRPVVKILESLCQNFQIQAVVTQEDKPVGRGLKLTPTPVKEFALQHDLPVFQPDKIKNITQEIKVLNPDFIVVAAYGQIIPQEILDIPKYGCINIHGSLLPRWRGASCVQAAILAGDKQAGPTIMKMVKQLDAGDILYQEAFDIDPKANSVQVLEKITTISAEILPEILKKYANKEIKPIPQDESKVTYAGLIKKEDGKIDWKQKAENIERLIRAMNPWPAAWSIMNFEGKERRIIFWQVQAVNDKIDYEPGVFFAKNKKLAVACQDGYLVIQEMQVEGKKRIIY